MAFGDFRKSILKVKDKRHHKIKDSLGVRDVFNRCRDSAWYDYGIKPKEAEFYAIVRGVNTLLADELIKGKEVVFPQKMGQLEVRKYDTYVKIVDGKLKTNRGIDWKATLQLWYEDEKAKENKTLIKVEDKEVFTVFYNRVKSNYPNKSFFQFRPNRQLMLAVRKAGNEGEIDAFTF